MVESLLRSLMHAGFIRQFEDHAFGYFQDLLSWLLHKSGNGLTDDQLSVQYILDQLYFNMPRLVKEDCWIKSSSVMETKALTIYIYCCWYGPYGTVPQLGMEDRLAHPKHPCIVTLYVYTDCDKWDDEACFLLDSNATDG